MAVQDSFRPRQAGELAMLSYPYPPRELAGCQGHLFRVHEAELVRVVDADSGYLQRADCLVCGRTSPRMDATWWIATPTEEAMRQYGGLTKEHRGETGKPAE